MFRIKYMEKTPDVLEELISALSDTFQSQARLLYALRKVKKAGPGRPALMLLCQTIEEGLQVIEEAAIPKD